METPGLPAKLDEADPMWLEPLRRVLQEKAGAERLLLTALRDGTGAIAVFPLEKRGEPNARIVDCSGAVRCNLEIPSEFRNGTCYYDAYYVQGELTAVFSLPGRDFACVIDEKTGKVLRSYETR
jgi:hypothetical protein